MVQTFTNLRDARTKVLHAMLSAGFARQQLQDCLAEQKFPEDVFAKLREDSDAMWLSGLKLDGRTLDEWTRLKVGQAPQNRKALYAVGGGLVGALATGAVAALRQRQSSSQLQVPEVPPACAAPVASDELKEALGKATGTLDAYLKFNTGGVSLGNPGLEAALSAAANQLVASQRAATMVRLEKGSLAKVLDSTRRQLIASSAVAQNLKTKNGELQSRCTKLSDALTAAGTAIMHSSREALMMKLERDRAVKDLDRTRHQLINVQAELTAVKTRPVVPDDSNRLREIDQQRETESLEAQRRYGELETKMQEAVRKEETLKSALQQARDVLFKSARDLFLVRKERDWALENVASTRQLCVTHAATAQVLTTERAALSQQLEKLREEYSTQRRKLDETEENSKGLILEIEALQSAAKLAAVLKGQTENKQIETLQAQVTNLAASLGARAKEVEQLSKAQAKCLAEFKSSTNELKQQVESLGDQLSEEKRKNKGDTARFLSDVGKVNDANRKLTEQIEKCEIAMTAAKAEAEAKAKAKAEAEAEAKAEAKAEAEDKEMKSNATIRELEDKTQKYAEVEGRLKSMEASLSVAGQELFRSRRHQTQLVKERDRALERLARTMGEVATFNAKFVSQQKEVATIIAKHEAEKAKAATEEEKSGKIVEQKDAEFEAKNKELTQQNEKLEASIKNLHTGLSAATDALFVSKRSQMRITKERDQALERLARTMGEVATVHARFVGAKTKSEKLQADLAAKCQAPQPQVVDENAKNLERVEAELAKTKSSLDEAKGSITNLKNGISATGQALFEAARRQVIMMKERDLVVEVLSRLRQQWVAESAKKYAELKTSEKKLADEKKVQASAEVAAASAKKLQESEATRKLRDEKTALEGKVTKLSDSLQAAGRMIMKTSRELRLMTIRHNHAVEDVAQVRGDLVLKQVKLKDIADFAKILACFTSQNVMHNFSKMEEFNSPAQTILATLQGDGVFGKAQQFFHNLNLLVQNGTLLTGLIGPQLASICQGGIEHVSVPTLYQNLSSIVEQNQTYESVRFEFEIYGKLADSIIGARQYAIEPQQNESSSELYNQVIRQMACVIGQSGKSEKLSDIVRLDREQEFVVVRPDKINEFVNAHTQYERLKTDLKNEICDNPLTGRDMMVLHERLSAYLSQISDLDEATFKNFKTVVVEVEPQRDGSAMEPEDIPEDVASNKVKELEAELGLRDTVLRNLACFIVNSTQNLELWSTLNPLLGQLMFTLKNYQPDERLSAKIDKLHLETQSAYKQIHELFTSVSNAISTICGQRFETQDLKRVNAAVEAYTKGNNFASSQEFGKEIQRVMPIILLQPKRNVQPNFDDAMKLIGQVFVVGSTGGLRDEASLQQVITSKNGLDYFRNMNQRSFAGLVDVFVNACVSNKSIQEQAQLEYLYRQMGIFITRDPNEPHNLIDNDSTSRVVLNNSAITFFQGQVTPKQFQWLHYIIDTLDRYNIQQSFRRLTSTLVGEYVIQLIKNEGARVALENCVRNGETALPSCVENYFKDGNHETTVKQLFRKLLGGEKVFGEDAEAKRTLNNFDNIINWGIFRQGGPTSFEFNEELAKTYQNFGDARV